MPSYRVEFGLQAHSLCTLIKLRDAMLAEGVIHADETPVQMLTPGAKKPHRTYV